jgi:hypothetical protein
MQVMAATTETKREAGPFQVPRGLDEWAVVATMVAWPLIFIFLLRRNMDVNAAGEAIAWLAAFAVQIGLVFALRTARRRGRA